MAKKVSRAMQREQLLHAAARVTVPSVCDVVVVGGGAAGLVAAIAAAEAGALVVVLEKDLECGRPILATGNGRCNFANTCLDPARYNKPDFVEAVCGERWLDDILDFFRGCNMSWCAEDDRLYPLSRQASSVRNVLLARARKAGVVLAPARPVKSIGWKPFELSTSEHAGCLTYVTFADPGNGRSVRIETRTVVLACGGMNQQMVEGIDLPEADGYPVLCPLACKESPLTALDGRRVHARASLRKAGKKRPCWSECGEVLFRSYGLSGIVIFDASRRAEQGDLIELDLVPELLEDELLALLKPSKNGGFEAGALDGVLDPAIASVLESLARKRRRIDWPGRTVPASDDRAFISLVKALPFVVEGLADADRAQVIRGGFLTSAFDPHTLAARKQPSLFACGEALDIDADCGGFNLSWAWKSGMVAGAAAADDAAARKARS